MTAEPSEPDTFTIQTIHRYTSYIPNPSNPFFYNP